MANQIPITFVMDVRKAGELKTVFKDVSIGMSKNLRFTVQQQQATKQMFRDEDAGYSKRHINVMKSSLNARDRLSAYRQEGREVAVLVARKEAYTRLLNIEQETHSRLIKAIGEERFVNQDYSAALEQRIRKQVTANMVTMEATQANRANRQALMQASISMFVMNIAIGQAVSTYGELLGLSEEMNDELKESALVMQAVLAPLQVMSSFMMIQAATATSRLATATIGLTGAVMGSYFAYKALTAEGSKARALYAVLSAATYGLTAAHLALSYAKWKGTAADIALKSSLTFGLATAGIVAAIIFGVGAVMSQRDRSLQTFPGQFWQVQKTGRAIVDEGEVVGRPAMGGLTLNFYGNVSGDGYGFGQDLAAALRDEGMFNGEEIGF